MPNYNITTLKEEINQLNILVNNTGSRTHRSLLKELLELKNGNNLLNEYINLVNNSLSYLDFIFTITDDLSKESNITNFVKIKQKYLTKSVTYEVIKPTGKQTITVNYGINSLASFINSILPSLYTVAVNIKLPNRDAYFLPELGLTNGDVNLIAQTVNPPNTLLSDAVAIQRKLQGISKIIDNLQTQQAKVVTPITQPPQTPNLKNLTVEQLLTEFTKNDYKDNYPQIQDTNSDKLVGPTKLKANINNTTFLEEKITLYKKHLNLFTKYRTQIIQIDSEAEYNKSIAGLNKDIAILTELKNRATNLPTTPTAVANSSVSEEKELIKQICKSNFDIKYHDSFVSVRNNFNNAKSLFCKNQNEANALAYIDSANNYIKATKDFISSPLFRLGDFINTADFTKEYNNSIKELEKLIQLLNKYINLIKSSKQDIKVNPPTPISSADNESTPSKENPTTTTEEIKPEVVPTVPEQWGMKFTNGSDTYYMSLLPARQSTIPLQGGRDVPNAMPGLNFKLIPAIGKQQIPGFSPVYQNLGIKGMQVIIVGAFTGADGANHLTDSTKLESSQGSSFFNSFLGGPSVSDNPVRDSATIELDAYRASMEFKKMAYEGKQLEVEINTFQIYKTVGDTKIGREIGLQSIAGNPKFRGVIRSLDEYHQTKERTWYTLIMDVTDFKMASKTNIDLNNKLTEAITKARNELKKAQAEAANPVNETRNDILSQIENSKLSQEDRNKKKAILDWFVSLSNEAVNSQGFLNPNSTESIVKQITGKPKFSYIQTIPLTDKSSLVKVAINCSFFGDLLGKYQAVRNFLNLTNVPVLNVLSAPTKFIQDLIGAAFFEPSISLAIESSNRTGFTCEKEHYFHLTNDENIIKEYLGNGNSKVTGSYYKEFPSSNSLPSLLSRKAQRLTPAEITRTVAESLGCVVVGTAADVAAGATIGGAAGAIAGGIGAAPGAFVGSITFGVKGLQQSFAVCSAGVSSSLYQRYYTVNQPGDPNEDDVIKQLQASVDLGETLRTFGVNYALGLTIGGTIKVAPKLIKQGATVASNSKITSFISNLINKAKANIGKTIKFSNKTAIIEAVEGVPAINGRPAVRLKVGNETYQVPIEDIASELDNISVTTTQPPVNTNLPSVNLLNKAINNSKLADEIKTALLNLSQKQKTAIVKLLRSNKPVIVTDVQGNTYLINSLDNINFTEEGIRVLNSNNTSQLIKYTDLDSTNIYVPISTPQTVKPSVVNVANIDNIIDSLDSSIISNQAKAALKTINNQAYKQKVVDILKAFSDPDMDLDILFAGGSIKKQNLSKISITNEGLLRVDFPSGGRIFTITEIINDITFTATPIPKPTRPQQLPSNNTNTSSNTGGGSNTSQTSIMSSFLRETPEIKANDKISSLLDLNTLSGTAYDNLKKLASVVGKQYGLLSKKPVLILSNGKKIEIKHFIEVTIDGELIVKTTKNNIELLRLDQFIYKP